MGIEKMPSHHHTHCRSGPQADIDRTSGANDAPRRAIIALNALRVNIQPRRHSFHLDLHTLLLAMQAHDFQSNHDPSNIRVTRFCIPYLHHRLELTLPSGSPNV